MFYNSSSFQHFLQLVSTIFCSGDIQTRFSSDILLPFPNLNDLNSCGDEPANVSFHQTFQLNFQIQLFCPAVLGNSICQLLLLNKTTQHLILSLTQTSFDVIYVMIYHTSPKGAYVQLKQLSVLVVFYWLGNAGFAQLKKIPKSSALTTLVKQLNLI